MEKQTKTFSIDRAASVIGCDRRTLARALANVRPDAHAGAHRRWTLRNCVTALLEHERRSGNGVRASKGRVSYNDGANIEALELLDELEDLFAEYDAGIAKLLAEPDIEKRRALNLRQKIGAIIPQLDAKMTAYCNAIDEPRGVGRVLMDVLLREHMGRFLAAIDMEPSYADLARWEAEQRASTEPLRKTPR